MAEENPEKSVLSASQFMIIVYFLTYPPSVYKKILGFKLSLFALLIVKS